VSYSISGTESFTIVNARRVTSKIAADLDLMRAYYGWPTADEITDFAEEAAILLKGRDLRSVEYGFQRYGKVIFALKYVARSDGTLQSDDRPRARAVRS
jgi:Bacterial HORMA domain family 1